MRVAIVQRKLPGERDRLSELAELAAAAGYCPVIRLLQVRPPDSRYQIGPGKLEELAKLVDEYRIEKVIFYNELKPKQVYNLMKKLGVAVMDRFELILEIFSNRAGSREAKLQIELARLKRELAFAKERISLSKRTEYAGFLGGGRYEYDAYYRHVVSRIAKINRELERLRAEKKRRVRRRRAAGLPTVALTGYTGAGKTTLFNRLTGEAGYVDGQPFATLSTTVRRAAINGRKILVSDTIGFIEDLPPLLVDAFYTTLEEIGMADLILLIADASEPLTEFRRKLSAAYQALETVGAAGPNILGVLNKVDLIDNPEDLNLKKAVMDSYVNESVAISALTGENLDELKERIVLRLPGYVKAVIKVPVDRAGATVKIVENSVVLRKNVSNGTLELVLETRKEWILRNLGLITRVGGSVALQ